MDFVKLTEAQRQAFDENGYLVVPEAIDAKTVDRLIEAGDRLMDSFEYDGFYAHRRPGIVQEEAFATLVSNSRVVPLIVQLLSPNIHITNTALIYKHPQPPESATSRNWHRDVGVHLDLGHKHLPRVGLKVGYCLTDFSEPNSGATLFVPKSNNSPEPLGIPKGKVDPPEFDEPRLCAGDAFLFESRVYHAPGLNFTDGIAKVVMCGYHYSWMRPDSYLRYYNDTLQPDEQLLEKLDDIGRQLLGAQHDTTGRYAINGVDWPLVDWAEQHGLGWQNSPQVVAV
ncbi:MAG: phytanoyl-CoA dioxygenase family protein [Candidatus Poribacteria bacterium]|nr:phytanoyl-CoA dioxygenase family protein [Candidatus Poribacteria bacterium]